MNATKTVFDVLIGKKVNEIYRSHEKGNLRFVTDQGTFDYYADGDCCSHSWFEHFSGLEALLGHVVAGVVEHESDTLGAEDPRKGKETDVERVYGWTFTTERGRADLDMRNDSNGYYGGDAVLNGSESWRTVKDFDAAVSVTEDF